MMNFIQRVTRNKEGKLSWWKIAISIYVAVIMVVVVLSIIFGTLMMIFNPEALEQTETTNVETTEVIEESDEVTNVELTETEESAEGQKAMPIPIDLTIDTELGYGEFIVGEDIEPGIYTCTVNPGEDETGAITVYGKLDQGGALRSENKPASEGDTSVKIDVEEGDTIKITGISSVHFEPLN